MKFKKKLKDLSERGEGRPRHIPSSFSTEYPHQKKERETRFIGGRKKCASRTF